MPEIVGIGNKVNVTYDSVLMQGYQNSSVLSGAGDQRSKPLTTLVVCLLAISGSCGSTLVEWNDLTISLSVY